MSDLDFQRLFIALQPSPRLSELQDLLRQPRLLVRTLGGSGLGGF